MHRLLALLLTLVPLAAHAQPALWALSDDDSTVYLLGSVHILTADHYPLSEAIETAYAAAEVLAFELDADEAARSASAVTMGLYTDGTALADHLAPATYARTLALADSFGLDPAMLSGLEPWLVSMTLSMIAFQQAGYTPEAGVDVHFFERAKADGKERVAFETLIEQMTMFDTMPSAVQEDLLRASLDDLADPAGLIDAILTPWLAGDEDGIARTLLASLNANPALSQRLLADRNAAWIPRIEALLAREGEDALVVVGAAHLVGEESVVALLRQRGYTVERR